MTISNDIFNRFTDRSKPIKEGTYVGGFDWNRHYLFGDLSVGTGSGVGQLGKDRLLGMPVFSIGKQILGDN